MKQQRKIIVDIGEDGEVQIETHNYKGPVCLAESKFLKDLLGEEIAQQLVPAFYEKQDQKIKKYLPLCG